MVIQCLNRMLHTYLRVATILNTSINVFIELIFAAANLREKK